MAIRKMFKDVLKRTRGSPGNENIEYGTEPVVRTSEPVIYITARRTHVRERPDFKSLSITTARKCDKLKYAGFEAEIDGQHWFRVEISGKNGWVYGKHCKLIS